MAMASKAKQKTKTAVPPEKILVERVQTGVRLEKRGHYVLHPESDAPLIMDIGRACRMVRRAMLVSAGLTLLVRMRVRRG